MVESAAQSPLDLSKFEESNLEINGACIRYFSSGRGNPVVMLDPLVGGISPLHQALAVDSRIIVFELPNPGKAADNPIPLNWKAMAETMAHIVTTIVPEKHTLIGTSAGANVALWQTLLTPDCVEALVLISPTLLLPAARSQMESPQEVAGFLCERPKNLSEDSSQADQLWQLAQLLQGVGHDVEAEGKLGEINCPTLVVFGSKDRVVPAEAARLYREKIPNSNVSVVYDAGHLIVADRPESLVNAVTDYVERRETFIVARQNQVLIP